MNNIIQVRDCICHKNYRSLGGIVVKITKNYVFYDDFDGQRKAQPIHISNIKNYKKI